MNFELIDLDKWFYNDISNYNSEGLSFLLTKCDVDKFRKRHTNSIRLVKLSKTNKLEDIVLPVEGVISSCICRDSKSYVIYNYRKNGQQIFCSTLTEKRLTKKPNTAIIPWNGWIIIGERQGVGFDYEDTIYECYDARLNLIWQYLHHGFINDGAYKIYNDYIEIGSDKKLFFNEKGILKGIKPQIPVEKSDWYMNDEERSFVKQVSENCVSHHPLSKSLFNGKEYVLHCNSTAKQYIAKFGLDFKLIWNRELPDCLGTYQLLFLDGIYYSIGYKTDDTFYICAVNENGKILDQSDNIKANEVYGYIVSGKLVIFYNRTDNLSKPEKKLYNDGVMIANGYCAVVNAR